MHWHAGRVWDVQCALTPSCCGQTNMQLLSRSLFSVQSRQQFTVAVDAMGFSHAAPSSRRQTQSISLCFNLLLMVGAAGGRPTEAHDPQMPVRPSLLDLFIRKYLFRGLGMPDRAPCTKRGHLRLVSTSRICRPIPAANATTYAGMGTKFEVYGRHHCPTR